MSMGELAVYRSCTPVVDAQYEPARDHSPAETVVDALSEAAGVDPVDLPALYEFVDFDALDSLFERHEGASDAHTVLSFKVGVWNVFVRGDGRIRVCDGTRHTEPEPVFGSRPA